MDIVLQMENIGCVKSAFMILIGRMPVNLIEAEIKGRDDRPPCQMNSPIHTHNG